MDDVVVDDVECVRHVRGAPMLRGAGTRRTAWCVAGGHRDALRLGSRRRRASGGVGGDPQVDLWSRVLMCASAR